VRGEVHAAPAQRARAPVEQELRADAVGRSREQPALVEREEPRELAPVDSTAARSRPTTAFAVSSDTPAAS